MFQNFCTLTLLTLFVLTSSAFDHHRLQNPTLHESPEHVDYHDGEDNDEKVTEYHVDAGDTRRSLNSEQPHHPNAIVKEPCPGCQHRFRHGAHHHEEEVSEEILRKLRLEKIKQKFLKKLRLKEPPNISGVKTLPDPFLSATYHHNLANRERTPSQSTDIDDYYGKTEQVIVFAEEPNSGGSSLCQLRRNFPSTCLTFKLPNEVAKEKADLRATSAELWVYAMDEVTNVNRVFTTAEITTNELYGVKVTSLDPRHTVNSTDGWEAMNVSLTVGAWMNKTLHFQMERDYPPLTLQIGCRNCTRVSFGTTSPIDLHDTQHRPFLVINMAEKIQRSRRRRNTNCNRSGPTECCRESLKVSFTEIGWGDWIIQPKEFDAYYCRGRCGGLQAVHHHTTAIQAQINLRNRTVTAAEAEALIPCCTPRKFSSISIIVSVTNTTSETRHLPNMVVDSCGCAGEEDVS